MQVGLAWIPTILCQYKKSQSSDATAIHERFLLIIKSSIEKKKEIEAANAALHYCISCETLQISPNHMVLILDFFFGLPHHAWKSERTGKNVLQNFHEALQSGFVITVSPNSYCILWVSYFSKKTISCLDNLSDSEMCLLFWHRLSSCVMPSTLARCKVKFTNCMWSKIKIKNLSMLNYMVKRSLCALSEFQNILLIFWGFRHILISNVIIWPLY